jgi:formate--tetrahydrofolate ligase
MALKLADYTVTEAGFGADLGAQKFFDIKCRMAGLAPACVVLVATVRALKYNGGVKKDNLAAPDIEAVGRGIVNLEKHIENIQKYNVPCVVTLNRFTSDSDEELSFVKSFCESKGAAFALSEVWGRGGDGGLELAAAVQASIAAGEANGQKFHVLYEDDLPLKEKISIIAKEIYGAEGISFDPEAAKQLRRIEKLGFAHFPVCMAKTQYSLSDNPDLLGRPSGFTVNVRDVYVSAGAGFVVAVTGQIMTMPGLPKAPAAEGIDIGESGVIEGLF